jgi:hypothetical protein
MSDLTWTNIDTSELSAEAQRAFASYVEAKKAANEARRHFEDLARPSIPVPAGTELKFAYNYGRIGIALAPAEARPRAKQSLADWIAAQKASGGRT